MYSINRIQKTTDGSVTEVVAEFQTLKDANEALKLLAVVFGVTLKDSLEGETDQWVITIASDATWRFQLDHDGWSYAVYESDPLFG